MTTKINFNEFVKNNSEIYQMNYIKSSQMKWSCKIKIKERDIWMDRLETLAAMLSAIVHFNKMY